MREEKHALVTGGADGIGLAIVQALADAGYRVTIADIDGEKAAARALELGEGHRGLACDITDEAQAIAAASAAPFDVLVNNAGIGYFGSLEESDINEVRKMFEINIWGLANMTRAVLPIMRKQRSGTIVNISSQGGLVANVAVSFYAATKFGVEALSESLSKEVAPLGIKVLIVEPSGFRTDWAGRSANEVPETMEDYRSTAGARLDMLRNASGNQPGDPVRAAKAIVRAVEAEDPPLRLLLGKEALANARRKIGELQKDFEGWAEVTEAADAPKA